MDFREKSRRERSKTSLSVRSSIILIVSGGLLSTVPRSVDAIADDGWKKMRIIACQACS